jgi:hypothetical protein
MCWFHIVQAVITRNPFRLSDAVLESVRSDMDILHNSPSREVFNATWKIVRAKWNNIPELATRKPDHGNKSFVEYFCDTWVESQVVDCSNWFLGCCGDFPAVSTNNPVESFNRHGVHVCYAFRFACLLFSLCCSFCPLFFHSFPLFLFCPPFSLFFLFFICVFRGRSSVCMLLSFSSVLSLFFRLFSFPFCLKLSGSYG